MFFKKLVIASIVAIGATLFTIAPASADCNRDQGCWGAVAQAIWNDASGTAYVAVGAALNYPTMGDAHRAALESCHRNTGGRLCTVAHAFKNSCYYITTGVRDNYVRWQTGSTAQSAYNQCVSGGYRCDQPIGGCAGG